ncbi:MAG: FeoB-associated Cys-rich membrane protein [Bacteroidia bacterium]|nr:FeoB-associated Cys-rich membrane protein [Bacteroidia bacterium]
MQEILTWIVVIGAVILLVIKASKSMKSFKKSDSCEGCGSSCEGCPIAPGNKKTKGR